MHEGYEWLYVLDGRLRMVLGEHDVVLQPGEVAEFDTRLPHWFGGADERQVEFLSIFGREGERMHIRASLDRPARRHAVTPRPREAWLVRQKRCRFIIPTHHGMMNRRWCSEAHACSRVVPVVDEGVGNAACRSPSGAGGPPAVDAGKTLEACW